jgi:DNA-binding FadR family transcriptional regulator
MSRNTIAIHVYSIIRESLMTSLKNIVTPTGQSNAMHFHPMVLKTIKEKDKDLATRYMDEHLQRVIERIYNDKTIKRV